MLFLFVFPLLVEAMNVPVVNLTEVVHLVNGVAIPRIAFGTASMVEDHYEEVLKAFKLGYRLIDTASLRHPAYNSTEVGRAVADSGLLRSEVYLQTKSNPWAQGYAATIADVKQSLSALRTDYIDVFLIHVPQCIETSCEGSWRDTWRAMESLVDKGVLRAIGVSNFDKELLLELVDNARIPPAIVQNRHDPLVQDSDVIDVCKKNHIFYQSSSTLGRKWTAQLNGIWEDVDVTSIASKHNATTEQVVLQWVLQSGLGALLKSTQPEQGVPLDKKDLKRLRKLDERKIAQKTIEQIRTTIEFRNLLDEPVLLFWVSQDGSEVELGFLEPLGEARQPTDENRLSTQLGHTFVVKLASSGAVLGTYTVRHRDEVVELSSVGLSDSSPAHDMEL